MTNLSKAYWATEGNSISFSMPIQKVDKERRIVSGWATLDMVDKQGDIVSVDASVKAFQRFRGNIREQHTPLAVGKMVSFKQDKYFDKESGNIYNGIFVDVYISKGAQDTWHKINESILTGFSIGGRIKDSEEVYSKNSTGPARLIKDYELDELSIVDNPACPAADIVSIQKIADGSYENFEKNYLESVFWCPTNDIILLNSDNEMSCPDCNKQMSSIGFVESNDINKSDTINALFETFKKSSDEKSDSREAIDELAKSIAENNDKEGISMAGTRKRSIVAEEDIVTKSEEVVDEVVEEVAVEENDVEELADEPAEEPAEEVIEKSEPPAEDIVVEEEVVEEADSDTDTNEELVKSVDEIKASLAEIFGDLSTTMKSLRTEIADLKKSIAAVNGEIDVVKGSVNEVKGNISEFGQRIDDVEADTAVRKSGDLGGIVQEIQMNKSMWGGRFLNSADLYR